MMDTAVTLKQAGKFFQVPPDTVKGWVSRYRIPPVGRRGQRGHAALYRLDDLIEGEYRARSAGVGRPRS